ncbi:MAG: DUF4837 family protein [Rikenellaceae bacterium]
MKRFTYLLLVAFVALSFISCDALHTASSNKVNSQGSPYELIIVCNQPEWEGELGDTLKVILRAEIPYLVQPEPFFSTYRVTQQGYDNIILKHRNIFIVNVAPSLEESSIIVQYDVNASPQIVMTLQGPNQKSLTEYVSQNREMVMHALEMAERDRDIAYGQKFSIASLDKLILEKFDVSMKIPVGYTLRNEGDDFMWMSYEYPTASQGVILYSYPSEGKASLKWEPLLEARNKYAARIPGPTDGSYMTTFMEVEPDYRLFRMKGRVWAELRGLWEVEGDYMGGPYVSYSTIDERTNRVFTLDCYVYSPKIGKRNYLRGVEHLLYNIEIE